MCDIVSDFMKDVQPNKIRKSSDHRSKESTFNRNVKGNNQIGVAIRNLTVQCRIARELTYSELI